MRCAFMAWPVLLGALAVAARTSAAGSCQVMVTSRPRGGKVFIDGKERGKTPLALMDLKTGFHDIRIVLEGHKAWGKRVKLVSGARTVDARLEEEGAPSPSGSKRPDKDGGAPPKTENSLPGPEARTGGDDEAEEEVPKKRMVPCPGCEGQGVIDEIGCMKCNAVGYVGVTPCNSCTGGRKQYTSPR